MPPTTSTATRARFFMLALLLRFLRKRSDRRALFPDPVSASGISQLPPDDTVSEPNASAPATFSSAPASSVPPLSEQRELSSSSVTVEAAQISPQPTAPPMAIISPAMAEQSSRTPPQNTCAGFEIQMEGTYSGNSISQIWEEAVENYQQTAGVDISVEGILFTSKADILIYLQDREEQFRRFRDDGPKWLRDRMLPVVNILEKLCVPIGEGLSTVFPPSKTVFAVAGILVKASTTVHDEFEAVGDAFDAMKDRILIIEMVTVTDHQLRRASVRLLVQIINVFGMITKIQKAGRFRAWLKGLLDAKPLSEALADLSKLSRHQCDVISVVTLRLVADLTSSLALNVRRDSSTTMRGPTGRDTNLAYEASEVLLSGTGKRVDTPDGNGWTTLHDTAAAGRLWACYVLIALGADVCARRNMDQQNDHDDILDLLLTQPEVNIEDIDKTDWTALHYAALERPPQEH
ncbi:hypothetical protein FB107DRAFT_249996 [Schizophyllum commune]